MMMIAAKAGFNKIYEYLMEIDNLESPHSFKEPIDMQLVDRMGHTVGSYIYEKGIPSSVQVFFAYYVSKDHPDGSPKVDPNAVDPNGNNILMLAAKIWDKRQTESIDILDHYQSYINAKQVNDDGEDIMRIACVRGHVNLLDKLIEVFGKV